MRFGLNVRAARVLRGLSQLQLAKDARISQRYLRDVEHGRANVRLHIVDRIATALQSTAADLFADDAEGR